MKKTVLLVVAGALAGCGSDSPKTTPPPDLTTQTGIKTYLEGKTLVMEGANIPTHPNGYNENMNLGGDNFNQCYNKTTITIGSDKWFVDSLLGTLNNAPNLYDVGTCDNGTPKSLTPVHFESVTVLIENVQGAATCFDITVTYAAFSQKGRGKISSDAKTITLELFLNDQATGNRCADGAVGSQTVTLNTLPFTGNSQQIYVVQ